MVTDSGQQEFCYSRGYKVLIWGLAIALAGLAAFIIWKGVLNGEPKDKPWAGVLAFGCTFSLLYTVAAIRKLDDVIVTNADGIALRHKNEMDVFISWDCLADVTEHRFMQRIDLFDKTRNKHIGIEYQIDRVGALLGIISEKAIKVIESGRGLRLFHRQLSQFIILIVAGLISLGVLFLIIDSGQRTAGIYFVESFFLLSSILFIFLGVAQSYQLQISDSGFSEISLFSKKVVLFSEVSDISLETRYVGRSIMISASVLLNNNKKLLFAHFKEGAIVLNAALKAALKNAIKNEQGK